MYDQCKFFRKINKIEDLIEQAKSAYRDNTQGNPYKILEIVELEKQEYKHFSENLLEDRDFIKQNTANSIVDFEGNWHCILVRERGKENAILVHSSGYNYARYTAIYE